MAENHQNANSVKKGGLTTTHKILIAGFLVVIAVIVGLFLYFNKKDEPAAPMEEAEIIMTEENMAELEEDLQRDVLKSQFTTNMNMKWSFPDGSSPSSDAVVGNSSLNAYPFYFTVTLNDTGEQVYKSGLVPVGKRIKAIVLDTDLPAGTYMATCKYHLIDENGAEVESTLGFTVTLTVEG